MEKAFAAHDAVNRELKQLLINAKYGVEDQKFTRSGKVSVAPGGSGGHVPNLDHRVWIHFDCLWWKKPP